MPQISVSDRAGSEILPILKSSNRWACWAYNDDQDFIPLDTGSYNDSAGEFDASKYLDPSIRLTYEEATELAEDHDAVDGIGWIVVGSDISYIDFDNCVDLATGRINDDIYDLLEEIDSYSELSISGTGVHVYCRGNAPSYGWAPDDHEHEISVFDGSWTVVTEDHLKNFPASVQSKPAKLREICEGFDIDTHGGWGSP